MFIAARYAARLRTLQSANTKQIFTNMATQEDLVTLFSRNLSLQSNPHPEQTFHNATNQPIKPAEMITYSATQHYTHSAHITPKRSISEPLATDQQTTEIILARHGVDANMLLPSQIDLFRCADASQQMRLVELWRICPPNYVWAAQDSGHWPATSFEQEEAMAQLRYERQMLEERASRSSDMGLSDGAEDLISENEQVSTPITPIQGGDSRWGGLIHDDHTTEPYMISGYESLAQREYEQSVRQEQPKDIYSHLETAVGGTSSRATDPVYNSIQDIHQWPNVNHSHQQQQTNQYGVITQDHSYGYAGHDEEML